MVKPAAASHFSISAPASVTKGVAFTVTVTALDPYGNVATGYTGTVAFRGGNDSDKVPANYTFSAADAGVHTFVNKTTIKKLGADTLSAPPLPHRPRQRNRGGAGTCRGG